MHGELVRPRQPPNGAAETANPACYLGVRKPSDAIYCLALQLTQREPDRCVFIDDRPVNLECAARHGLHTIRFQDAVALRADLERFDISVGHRAADNH